MKGATLSTPPITGLSGIQFSNTHNYIRWSKKTRTYRYLQKDRNTGRLFTAATLALNTCYSRYKEILVIWSPRSKICNSDCSLAVMKGTTPPSTGLSGIQFSTTPNYIS